MWYTFCLSFTKLSGFPELPTAHLVNKPAPVLAESQATVESGAKRKNHHHRQPDYTCMCGQCLPLPASWEVSTSPEMCHVTVYLLMALILVVDTMEPLIFHLRDLGTLPYKPGLHSRSHNQTFLGLDAVISIGHHNNCPGVMPVALHISSELRVNLSKD